jgi:hypothetical protein
MIVLKISCGGDIHRIQLLSDVGYASMKNAVQGLWPRSSIDSMKYIDEEGDHCTLVEATFTDFMETSQATSCGRQMLKVEVARSTPSVSPEEAESSDVDSSLGDDWEFVEFEQVTWTDTSSNESPTCSEAGNADTDMMREIQAELDRAKAACEAELERHLDDWLSTSSERLNYENWIAAVHPENTKENRSGSRVVDSRMYLEGSFHRQLWNSRIADLKCWSEAEKQRSHVAPR